MANHEWCIDGKKAYAPVKSAKPARSAQFATRMPQTCLTKGFKNYLVIVDNPKNRAGRGRVVGNGLKSDIGIVGGAQFC